MARSLFGSGGISSIKDKQWLNQSPIYTAGTLASPHYHAVQTKEQLMEWYGVMITQSVYKK